ncbi:MAG: hypothetical protein WA996_19475, partial [Candidatus Promineifilaceae bacterium]
MAALWKVPPYGQPAAAHKAWTMLRVAHTSHSAYGYGCHFYSTTLLEIVPKKATPLSLTQGGFVPQEQEQIRLCSQMGLGPGRLDQIKVVGESIEDVQFTLGRLNDGILELPIPYCLDRLSLGELQIIGKGLKMHGFLPADAVLD